MREFDIYDFENGDFFKKTRTITLLGEVNAGVAYEVTAKLKYLDYIDSEKPITIEINSPGGEVTSGLAIIDTMNYIKAPVRTVICGMACSMAAVIAACGSKGLRMSLPHSTVMIHQPKGGLGVSQATDIEIYSKQIERTKNVLNEILADVTGKSRDEVQRDTDRDFYMNAEEAKEYGIIDKIIGEKKEDTACKQ